jgi:hypothetical protein
MDYDIIENESIATHGHEDVAYEKWHYKFRSLGN